MLVFCGEGEGDLPVAVGYLCGFERLRFGDAVDFVAKRKPCMSVLPQRRP